MTAPQMIRANVEQVEACPAIELELERTPREGSRIMQQEKIEGAYVRSLIAIASAFGEPNQLCSSKTEICKWPSDSEKSPPSQSHSASVTTAPNWMELPPERAA
jgi:hypothetical protein